MQTTQHLVCLRTVVYKITFAKFYHQSRLKFSYVQLQLLHWYIKCYAKLKFQFIGAILTVGSSWPKENVPQSNWPKRMYHNLIGQKGMYSFFKDNERIS